MVSGTLPTLFRAHTLNEILTDIVEPAADTAAESDCEKFLHDIVNGDVTPFGDDPGNRSAEVWTGPFLSSH